MMKLWAATLLLGLLLAPAGCKKEEPPQPAGTANSPQEPDSSADTEPDLGENVGGAMPGAPPAPSINPGGDDDVG